MEIFKDRSDACSTFTFFMLRNDGRNHARFKICILRLFIYGIVGNLLAALRKCFYFDGIFYILLYQLQLFINQQRFMEIYELEMVIVGSNGSRFGSFLHFSMNICLIMMFKLEFCGENLMFCNLKLIYAHFSLINDFNKLFHND